MLRFNSIKTDLKYKNQNLQIKSKNKKDFEDSQPFSFISEKTNDESEEYFNSKITLTLFIIYELNGDFFEYRYFLLTKNELIEYFKDKDLPKKERFVSFYPKKNKIQLTFLKKFIKKASQIPFKQFKLRNVNLNFQDNTNIELVQHYFNQIETIINSNIFNNNFFNILNNNSFNKHDGLNGNIIETLVLQHLQNSNKFTDLNFNQAIIETITDRRADFTIGNIPFQLKTLRKEVENVKNTKQFQPTLFRISNFPKTFKEQKECFNSLITNMIIISFSFSNKNIEIFFHFKRELKITEKSINKDGEYFNVKISDVFSVSLNNSNQFKLNLNKSHPIHKICKKRKIHKTLKKIKNK